MRLHLRSGRSVSYVPAGQGELTFVFLHPIGLDHHVWERTVEQLAPRYRCLSLDLPGHGGSDFDATPITIDTMVGAVAEVVDTLAGSRVVLAGCSMGSAIAAATAARIAELRKVAGLVLSSATYARAPDRHANLTKRSQAARAGMAAVARPTTERWFSPQAAAEHPELVDLAESWLLEGDPIVHAWCWELLRDFDYAPVVPAIGVPTLVIAGADDPSAKPAAVRTLADAIAGAEYVEIPGAGHLSPLEQPEAFAASVTDFVIRRLG